MFTAFVKGIRPLARGSVGRIAIVPSQTSNSSRLIYHTAVKDEGYEEIEFKQVASKDNETCANDTTDPESVPSLFCEDIHVVDRRGEGFYERDVYVVDRRGERLYER
mmetsp:Transcript_18342/g.22476  ORF Transcript_18342/g.22476 Transcript_18342/m.22476 type:complete len:107 (-) Transcript_18342:390-710(-)|eukprot:CAMPEP_0204833962 /NCGR_PEP_ID=MMETSP1346-20131115/18405_1 /ASSEMBLY_ACC=CAM_ASM_000771 /TAXON_ID=215587 /ORGANISM="Aplanochytrium stocchinoi, Strain GSBS06" /LENGTH=106 /DNA_ID=CAMNT_0051966919 /DNA_START=352 /DNA_END=672 /DNA_ORIENTATION=+